ncbi:MAG: PsbP [Candidatus Eremiobacteraeota bacterium]|nr:PsbP [Candidatus Eremiobacteraeota bacterium]
MAIKELLGSAAAAALLWGCAHGGGTGAAASTTTASPATTAAAVAAAAPAPTTAAEGNQANSAGDIPDTQAFVTYAGPGYSVLVPEGWSRTQRGSTTTFTWNANGETIDVGKSSDSAAMLRGRFGAFGPITFRRATIGGAAVTVARFTSRSAPNAVTGKSVGLENEAYVFDRGGRRAVLVLSAPAGADNVDQWKKISESFRWK